MRPTCNGAEGEGEAVRCQSCGAAVVERGGEVCNAGRVRLRVVGEGGDRVVTDDGRTYRGRVVAEGEPGAWRRAWTVEGHVPHLDTCPAGERAQRLGHRAAHP